MNKFLITTAAATLMAGTAFAGGPVIVAEEDTVEDPFVPAATAGSEGVGVGTALAIGGGVLVLGALIANSDSDSSTGTTGSN